MSAWTTISIDNKTEIGSVKYGVPYFIKYIPNSKIETDYTNFVARIDKKIYVGAMKMQLKESNHPVANYFVYRGIQYLLSHPGKNIILDYKDVNLDWQKDLHVKHLVSGSPIIPTNKLYEQTTQGLWLDLMALTGFLHPSDLIGVAKYLSDVAKNINSSNNIYIKTKALFGKPVYKIPESNGYISSNWYNYFNKVNNFTNEFAIFISTLIKHHNFPNTVQYKMPNIARVMPKKFTNYKSSYYDIGSFIIKR